MTSNPTPDRPVNDMRELYAVQHAITDAGGTLTPGVHKAIDDLREVWDAGLRQAQAEARQYGTALQGVARQSAAVPSVSAVDQTTRDRIAEALVEARRPGLGSMTEAEAVAHMADAVLRVLPEPPLSPDYQHPECGFSWHGRDGMDIPMRDGQPVCPRCELARVEKLLAHRERRCEELRVESRRRGKVKLEYAEKIHLLEKQLDEVRSQLGAEILRAGQAEDELRRVAEEARDEQEAQAHFDQLADELPAVGARQPDTETHVVADDSDDSEHVDGCPGCTAFTLTGHITAAVPGRSAATSTGEETRS